MKIILQKQQQMEVIELNEGVRECRQAEVRELLRAAFQSQGFHPVRIESMGSSWQKQAFHGTLALTRAQSWVGVAWRVRVSEGGVMVELCLSNGDGGGGNLRGFLCSVGEQVGEFIHLMNNLSLCDREGYFIFKQLTGQLILRYKISKIRYLSNSLSRLRYINRSIATAIRIFSEHLEQIIFYYRLPGFGLDQLEQHFQHRNHVPLRQEADNIIFLQHSFQAQRCERKGSSREQYRTHFQMPLQMYTGLLFSTNSQIKNKYLGPPHFEQRLHSIQNQFKFEIETLLQDLSHKKKKSSELILTSIKIKEKAKELVIGTGGYAEIIYGIYSYVPQISIYGGVPPHELKTREEEAVMKNCSLVKKIGLQSGEGEANISLENQCNFLKYIRNKVCPYIAKYFCNSDGEYPFSDGEIYLEYYPNNLGECRLTESRKMKVIEDVCMALLFLGKERLIHRDLKEVNIMVDRYHRGRLIDFGSVSNVTGSSNFKTKDEKVRSTVGYYLPYRDAVAAFPALELQLSRNEYYSHETFDLYGLGQVLQNEFYLTQVVGHSNFVRHNLMLLSRKCRQINPDDRWTIQQVIVFLRHLLLFSQLRREFWRWGFDPRFRAHELGKQYNGNGYYESRQEEAVFKVQVHLQK